MNDADESVPGDAAGAARGSGPRAGDTAERPAVRLDDATREAASASPLVAAMRAAEERASGDDPADGTPGGPADPGPVDAADEPRRPRRRGRVLLVAALVLVVLAGGLYVAAYAVAGDKVARGTTVAGIDVGGLTRDEAATTLGDALADRAERPVQVTVAGSDASATLDPASVGMAIDVEASLDEADARRSWSPRRLWGYFTGGEALDAVVESDPAAVEEFLAALVTEAGQPPVEGAVAFVDGQVSVTEPAVGRGFEAEAALAALEDAFVGDDATAELQLTDVAPEIDAADVEAAVADFAEPAVSAPVTLVFGESPVTLEPAEFGPALAMVPEGGALVGTVDGAALREIVGERVGDPGRPVDAGFEIVDGAPVVVPAQPGVDFLPETLASVFTPLLTAPDGSRQGTVEATTVEPDLTTEEAEALGIVEEVSEFTTYYPHASYRNTNIGRAAELIDGTVLLPGETFSLNGTVGERTEENGFTAGFIIANGIFREELGGGVSQIATTTFNAAYFAGLKDVEHKPHSLYIDRYPEGREATVAWPTVDLKFENDTEHGVYIQTVHQRSSPGNRGSITVRMFSTKTWDIESDVSGRYNYTSSTTRTLTDSDCEAQSGSSGFSVDYDRIFRRPGSSEVVRREDFSWTYDATPTVRCVDPTPAQPAQQEQSAPSEQSAPPAETTPPADPAG